MSQFAALPRLENDNEKQDIRLNFVSPLVTIKTVLAIENLKAWESLLPDNNCNSCHE